MRLSDMLGGGLLAECVVWFLVVCLAVVSVCNGYLAWIEFKKWREERKESDGYSE